jgi:hypothetical protein
MVFFSPSQFASRFIAFSQGGCDWMAAMLKGGIN